VFDLKLLWASTRAVSDCLSKLQQQALRLAFSHADADGDGSLDLESFSIFLAVMVRVHATRPLCYFLTLTPGMGHVPHVSQKRAKLYLQLT